MRYDALTPLEKMEFKDNVIKDFVEHGMTEEEALVNYVHCVNRDPVKWMNYKYGMGAERVAELKASGLESYKENGGAFPYSHVSPPGPRPACRCVNVISPQ
ncbi:MAG: hypothetical protein LBT41_02880 [Candidatus Methanoplasma sp.]|nr:hypothetical protein [Candidatus Methanoplasma sp.]